MARGFHEAVGVSFHSADPQKYLDALLHGLMLAWGTKVTCFNLTLDAATVTFAICNLVSKELAKSGAQKYARSQTGAKSTPKKQPTSGRYHGMAGNGETKRREGQVGCDAGATVKEEEVFPPERTHKEPSYKNALWLQKGLWAPRQTRKICSLLEDLMEADETNTEADMGAVGMRC